MALGDINTRFADREYQDGRPWPPDRIAVLSSFLQSNQFARLKPYTNQQTWSLESRLTVDHCFLRGTTNKTRLSLLSNESLRLKTDHRYTMHLTMYDETSTLKTALVLPRYRISRLSKLEVEKEVRRRFNLSITNQNSRDSSIVKGAVLSSLPSKGRGATSTFT